MYLQPPTASISQDHWGRHKRRLGAWGTEVPQRRPGAEPPVGSLGDASGVQGQSPGRGSGGRRSWRFFCETTHNICVKIQQTTVAVTRVDILNDIISKILGGHYYGCPFFINFFFGGTFPPPLSHRDRRPWQPQSDKQIPNLNAYRHMVGEKN